MKHTSLIFKEGIDVNKNNILEVLINAQFKIARYTLTYNDILGVDDWYTKYEINMEDYNKWQTECINIIARVYRVTKKRATYEASMIGLNYGLKFKDE